MKNADTGGGRNPAPPGIYKKPYKFIGFLIIMSKTIGIHMVFEHDDQKTYEFILFLVYSGWCRISTAIRI